MIRFKEYITLLEGLSPVLFHSTSINTLHKILKDNEFRLTPDIGTGSETLIRTKNRIYYMSFSRSPINDYHYTKAGGNCVLVVDGDAMKRSGFVGEPVDYWEGTHHDEMEDRLFHDKPTIRRASRFIKEIHAMPSLQYDDRKKMHVLLLRKSYILASKLNVPLYTYLDPTPYKLLDKRRAVPISKIEYEDVDLGKPYSPYKYRNDFAGYLELLSDVPNNRLSKEAKKTLRKIIYDNYLGDVERSLAADIHNSRQGTYRGDLDKFLKRTTALRLYNVKEILAYIENKRGDQ
jgi:hypothetical protein